eukprot:4413282-Pyramimonas_sp.AAC.1
MHSTEHQRSGSGQAVISSSGREATSSDQAVGCDEQAVCKHFAAVSSTEHQWPPASSTHQY